MVINYASVNPQDAKINGAIDAWVAKRKGKGQAAVDIGYDYDYDHGTETYNVTLVFSVTWESSGNNSDYAFFDWKTLKKLN